MITNTLDNIKLVDRVNYLKELCRDKRVLHLGATDAPMTKQAISNKTLLHLHLNETARELVGLDLDRNMIEYLRREHSIHNIMLGNIEKSEDYPPQTFDIILAGEILEHLSNPGNALESIKSVVSSSSKIIITVPNAYSVKAFVRAVARHELIHPDHTLYHSPHTLFTLVERHGFHITNYFSYLMGGKGAFASIANAMIRLNPQLAEGIGIICQAQ